MSPPWGPHWARCKRCICIKRLWNVRCHDILSSFPCILSPVCWSLRRHDIKYCENIDFETCWEMKLRKMNMDLPEETNRQKLEIKTEVSFILWRTCEQHIEQKQFQKHYSKIPLYFCYLKFYCGCCSDYSVKSFNLSLSQNEGILTSVPFLNRTLLS